MAWTRMPGRWRSLALLAGLAGVCGSAFTVVYLATVQTTAGRLLGDASLRGAMRTNSRAGDLVDAVLGVVSVASLLAAVAAIAVIALLRRRRSLGLAAIGLVVAANGSTWLLKNVALSRPDLGLRELTPATLNSLPSGRSTAALSAVIALLFVLPAGWRDLAATTGGGYACLTALATMSAGWHRAGDSLAAFLLVGVCGGFAGLAVVILDDPETGRTGRPQPAHRTRRWAAITAAGSLAVGTAAILGLYADHRLRDSAAGGESAFVAGGLLIVGTATAVLIATLAVLDRIAPAPATRA